MIDILSIKKVNQYATQSYQRKQADQFICTK